jgi:hypothetical protein
VQDDDHTPERDGRSDVERLVDRSLIEAGPRGKPLPRSHVQRARSVESYLQAGVRPRWMERVADVDRGIAGEKRRLERAYRALQHECGSDRETFARRWRARARAWRFDWLNELIQEHNEWYPVERRLPMDPRTGDYVPVGGRSYRRPVLGPEWVLEQFPPGD